ncbi:MAG: DUF2853 family protein [Novosphingobium sp.]
MAEDWLANVRKHAPDADEGVVAAIVKYCGISLQNTDSSRVAFSDPAETGRVRENYLKKKLGLAHDDATLDAGIAAVGDRLKGDPTKNRVTVYYLLADHFGLLNVFGGTAKVSPLAGAGVAAGAAAASTIPPRVEPEAAPQAAYSAYKEKTEGGGIGRWLPWILLALLALALLYALRTCSADRTVEPVATTEPPAVPAVPAPAAVVIPTGAGVVASDRDSKPMLTVYFQTAMSEVHNDLSTAASGVKNYLDTHPNATLAVSGYNDPTGDAAANAALAKSRAENVRAALEKAGISAPRIVLEKPVQTTGTGDTNAESRRVEVVVKE